MPLPLNGLVVMKPAPVKFCVFETPIDCFSQAFFEIRHDDSWFQFENVVFDAFEDFTVCFNGSSRHQNIKSRKNLQTMMIILKKNELDFQWTMCKKSILTLQHSKPRHYHEKNVLNFIDFFDNINSTHIPIVHFLNKLFYIALLFVALCISVFILSHTNIRGNALLKTKW